MADAPARADPIERLEVFITAQEAYPAFERAVLAAQDSILCGFRIFDLDTRLRSAEASARFETWFDLFGDALSRGVDITIVVTDFDPILATQLHRQSWATARRLAALDEVVVGGRPGQPARGKLRFRIARHPARAGLLPRLLFRAKVARRLARRTPDALTPGLANASPGDLHPLYPVTHHHKLAVFDNKRLYIGGLDVDERRFDTTSHDRAAAQTWADVMVMAEGPVVQKAVRHLETFEAVAAGRQPPERGAPGFVRTLSARRRVPLFRIAPHARITEIEALHLRSAARAERFIYLETQFFRHLPLADALAEAAARAPDLRLMVVLPAAPEQVAFDGARGRDVQFGEALQARAIERLTDAFGARCLIAAPAQRRPKDGTGRDTLDGAPIIYVHSKVSTFDSFAGIVSSANLNGRSMLWDTEAGLHLTRPGHIAQVRGRVLAHWVPGVQSAALDRDPAAFDALREQVYAAADQRPGARQHLLLPYKPGPAAALGQAVAVAPDALV